MPKQRDLKNAVNNYVVLDGLTLLSESASPEKGYADDVPSSGAHSGVGSYLKSFIKLARMSSTDERVNFRVSRHQK